MQASESPGGPGENATLDDFPKGTKPNLCAKDKTEPWPCLTEHEYAFGDDKCRTKGVPECKFEDVPAATAFNYDTHTKMPFKKTEDEIKKLKLKKMPTTPYPKLSP